MHAHPARPRPANDADGAEAFVASLSCPFCRWGSVASAPTYREAQALVSESLLSHIEGRCAQVRKAA